MHFTDDTKNEYRSLKEIKEVESAVETATSTLSEELIEEFETSGLDISKDERESYKLISSVLQDNSILQKIYEKIDKLVSDLP